jgi:ribosome maturation protein Sdo1
MPIERAHMRLRISAHKEGRKLKEKLSKLCTSIESEEWEDSTLILVSLSLKYTFKVEIFFKLKKNLYRTFLFIIQ